MKKFFLTLCMCFAVMTASAQTLTWDDVVDIFQDIMAESGSEIEYELASVGADCNFSSSYNQTQKSFDMDFNFYDPDLVETLTNSDLTEVKNSFIYSFIASAVEDGDTTGLKEILKAMERNNGKIKMVFKALKNGQPISKSVTITAADLKNNASNDFGVRL